MPTLKKKWYQSRALQGAIATFLFSGVGIAKEAGVSIPVSEEQIGYFVSMALALVGVGLRLAKTEVG